MSEATNTVISVADRSVKAITTATAALSKVVADLVTRSGTCRIEGTFQRG